MKDPRDLLLAVLARLPLGLADKLAWLVAWTWWWILPIRAREASLRLREALPDAHPRRVLTRMMHDLALGYIEILQFDRLQLEVEGAESVAPGSLVLAGHGGSWDIALLGYGDVLPLAIFLRTPTDRWTREWLASLRRAHDVQALETGSRMEDAYSALEAGRSVYFIQDQRHGKGIPSPFFGKPARTSAGIAAAHLRTGRPIVGAWQWRTGVGRHHLQLVPLALPPLTGDRVRDTQAITDATNAFYEARIRERPHGWLWLHRRWK